MSRVQSIKQKISSVKLEVEEKLNRFGEKSEECVTIIERAAKKSAIEVEEKLNYLGERSEECVSIIGKHAKKSVCHLKATVYPHSATSDDVEVPAGDNKNTQQNDTESINKEFKERSSSEPQTGAKNELDSDSVDTNQNSLS